LNSLVSSRRIEGSWHRPAPSQERIRSIYQIATIDSQVALLCQRLLSICFRHS
jgi:hypothetical protein